MFKWLFKYWFNPTDTPSINSKLNLWFFINIRLFKVKLSSYIYFFILNLKNLKLKKIKIFHKNISFLNIYTSKKFNIIFILTLLLLFFL